MYLRSDERGPPMRGNSLTLRMAIFGAVALALFVILFFRLWFLQVLNGPKYLADANSNRTREFKVSAPRGKILDREGEPLVVNRTSLELQVNLQKLPPQDARRKAELTRLAELTHTTLPRLLHTIGEESKVAFGAPVTLRRDIGYYLFYYLQENQDRFPGVVVQRVFVRRYPHGTLAAHVLGTVGEVTEEELEEPRYKRFEPGEEVGKEGVEDTYDRFLRGKPGVTRIQVDAFGQPTPGGRLVSRRPVPGDNLKLTLDGKVQEAGEAAMAAKGLPGAFVTMDIHSGEILGLGSFPVFEPELFTKPQLTQKDVEETYNNPLGPMTDRAISGYYPTGSTFKIITALAALSSGVTTLGRVIDDNGFVWIDGQKFEDSEGVGFGPVSLVSALKFSSDVYFYTLGDEMWNTGELQHWARELGIGRNSGIDLPGAVAGLLPTKRWRDREAAEGRADGRPWSTGDNVQLATGQGDLQTNPLQMAIAYAALGNGGTIVTPHVGKEIDDSAGRVLREFDPGPRRHVNIDPAYRSAILEGLHEAAQTNGGTSCSSFCGFKVPVAGKTGTAERQGHLNQSWYIVLAPYPNPRIVTAVTMEEGGFGAESAAPAAKEILEAYFGGEATEQAGAGEGGAG
jgi:penicillin-binding protein 2